MPGNTLSPWILYLGIKGILYFCSCLCYFQRLKLSYRKGADKKIFKVCKPQMWAGVERANGAPPSQLGKAAKEWDVCALVGGHLVLMQILWLPTQHSLKRGCGCSLWTVTPQPLNSKFNLLLLRLCCEKVGFPPHSICLQAQAQLQGIQFSI